MKKEIKCIKNNSKYFPKNLRKLKRPPEEIFVLGDEKILSEFSLSIVGSRKCSFLGKEVARSISDELARRNITIVSGFARGIDTTAHKSCVKNKKKTIAVLGGGHGNIYPKENSYLIGEILENGGAVISEYPFDYPPLPNNFRERNRIIAALSKGVILIEARKNSGSLITIKYAQELKKKIFVVPGSLNDEMYDGSNLVLSEGAFCVRNADDILKKYKNIGKNNSTKIQENVATTEFAEVFDKLSFYPMSFEEICLKTNKSANEILYQLTMLEMQGLVKQVERRRFVKVK